MPEPPARDLLVDLGGAGPTLHLAHANGFPPATYQPLADELAADYHVVGLPARPLWPGSRPADAPTWRPLADDLVHGLDSLGLRGVYGVGHSLGGVLTMWAAIQRPDLFAAVVLIDPVILLPAWLLVARLLRRVGLGRRQPLVQGALRRRRTWSSRAACFEQYRARPVFGAWPDASLWAYVRAGARELPDGTVELVYPAAWEAHIFATAPVDVWRTVPRLRTPALVIRGERSNTFRAACQQRLARLLPQARFVVIPGAGHLAPMEQPGVVAAAIRDFLAAPPS